MNGLLKLDRIDINILAHLQQNCQLTNIALADAVNLSPSPCLTRVKRLEKAGYINSYNARLNLVKIVDHIIVFTEVTLAEHNLSDFIRFETEIKRFEALQECHMVSGGYDYLLRFVARNVMGYQQLMESVLERGCGISKYFSYIVIKTVVMRESAPLKILLADCDDGA